jgi:glycosyltransferase involved in cell wall biosynthesis
MTERLRILLVAHGWPPESVGGVEQHVAGLARALLDDGHEVTVYAKTSRRGQPGALLDEDDGDLRVTRVVYRYEGLDSLAALYRVPLLDAAFARFLDKRRFDVCHIHHLTGMSTGILDVLAARGVPAVLTLHDYWLICPRGQMWHRNGTACATVEPQRCAACLAPTFGGWLPAAAPHAPVADLHAAARALLERADRLVVPSARAMPPFLALGLGADRFRVVENGVDTHALACLPDAERPPGAPLRVGYLGTLIPSKGLDVLVDACRALPPGTATLAVFGNAVPYHGDEGFLTRVFARLRPGDRVGYHGPYLPAELPGILAQVDVVAAPALWQEAFGLTVREALAAGRPVLVSAIGGLQDAITDGVEGLRLPPGDVAAWTAALAALAADRPRLAAMSRDARSRGRGFAPMAAELADLYREVAALDRHPGNP